MRFHERPVRCASSILLLKILADKHSRGCYRRISSPPDTEFSLHHVSTSQTQTFSKSRFKNTAIYFPAVTDFFTSGEVGLNRVTAEGDDLLKEFADRVKEIFSRVTRDAAKLEFDGSLPAHVQRGTVMLEPTRLSQGAGGALALAIRLAMAEAYLKESGGFIMLDDPLVHFDAGRAAEAADIIRAFAERHQVIFFTCHQHHAEQLRTK